MRKSEEDMTRIYELEVAQGVRLDIQGKQEVGNVRV